MKTYTCPICDHTFEAEDAKTCPVCGSLLETVSDEELEKKITEAKKDTEVKRVTTKSPTSTSSSSRSTTSSRSTSSTRSTTSSSYRSTSTSSRTTTPPSSTISPSLLKRHPVTPPPTPTYTRSTPTPTSTRRTTTTSTRTTSTRTTTYSTKSYRGYHIYNLFVGIFSLIVILVYFLNCATTFLSLFSELIAIAESAGDISLIIAPLFFSALGTITNLVFLIIAFVNFIFLIINIAQNTPLDSTYLLTLGRKNAVKNNHMAFIIIGGILIALPLVAMYGGSLSFDFLIEIYRTPIILLIIYIILTIIKNVIYKKNTK